MQPLLPFYNPYLSYEENYNNGPFGLFCDESYPQKINLPKVQFLDQKINFPFGIPAGPLINANYIKAAFQYGYDLCVYKTVRTRSHSCHPMPNILAVHVENRLSHNLDTVIADTNFNSPLSITNSFGVPSFDPDVWQPDMAKAVEFANEGQYVIGSFQGTQGQGKIELDYALAAKLVDETGVAILETNLSCPNEGANQLLCFDIDKVERIVNEIKTAVPDKPLIIKLAYFSAHHNLNNLLKRIGTIIDGISTINTIPAKPINHIGQPALGEMRPESGICGDAIRWAGLDMVNRLAKKRQEMNLQFSIIGVGGVNSYEHYQQYIQQGADAVMSATGSMWNPLLANEIQNKSLINSKA